MVKTFEKIDDLYENFKLNHEKHVKGNVSAGKRARKALNELKKEVVGYRKLSNEFGKE